MRFPVLIVAFLLCTTSWAKTKTSSPKAAYLDIEDGQKVSIFNVPGKNWKNCDEDPKCKAVAWPDNTASIKVLSPVKKIKVVSPYTGKLVTEEYVLIDYSYERTVEGKTYKQQGQGWIDAASLSNTKKKSFYTDSPTQKIDPKELCEPKNPLKDLEKAPQKKSTDNTSIKAIAAQLMPLTGQCVIDPKAKTLKSVAGNAYDEFVLNTIRQQKIPSYIMKEAELYEEPKNGNKPKPTPQELKELAARPMTVKDLVDIDALARTMYGEMAGCFKHGLQYPMTVARLAKNRAVSGRDSEFIKGPHSANKNKIAKVVTSSSQFNVWMPKHKDGPNNSLKLALCPPSNAAAASWQGHKPSSYELEIWENAMRIATEAVLFPQTFKKRTAQVREFHYTSGTGKFYNMKQVFPWVEDRKVSKNACVEVWQEKPKT